MRIELEIIADLMSEGLRRLPVHKELDIYSDGGADELEEDDEISAAECGFMRGYLESE